VPRIEFILTDEVKNKLINVLNEYDDVEIGGILVGIKEGENLFKIVDLSIPDKKQKFFRIKFSREKKSIKKFLKNHYKNDTGRYIGEWHSHPTFSLNPSHIDINTMVGIINDKNYGVTFAVLLIVQRTNEDLNYKGYFFHQDLDRVIVMSEKD